MNLGLKTNPSKSNNEPSGQEKNSPVSPVRNAVLSSIQKAFKDVLHKKKDRLDSQDTIAVANQALYESR